MSTPLSPDRSTEEMPSGADWDEWDGSSPFWIHCLAGSLAGCIEHVALYPLDTVRTHIQVCAACIHNPSSKIAPFQSTSKTRTSTSPLQNSLARQPYSQIISAASHQRLPLGVWGTIRYLMNEPTVARSSGEIGGGGISRLFRGISTVWVGCIPAHALYFSSYEGVKHSLNADPLVVSLSAGAAAVTGHDIIMTPLDTLKQRMQMGQYSSLTTALSHILRKPSTFYHSLGVTLATNLPYGMLMVATQDAVRDLLHNQETKSTPHYSTSTLLLASSSGGCVAAALTTPLDRIKTAHQTNMPCLQQTHCRRTTPIIIQHIYRTEGWQGFWRGMVPRVLAHTPAVAISWTTYETVKQWLLERE